MSSSQLIPSTDLSPEETLRTLGTNFKIAQPVLDYLLKSGIENLEEFRFFWDDESKIESWLGKVGLKDEDKNIQGARVRRAWAAVRLWFTQAEQDRSKVATSDLDSMLQESELRDVKLAFWVRYRQRFPPEVHPSDSTLSRVSREMSKRMLCVFSIWKVRSLQFQLHTTNKKRKLADGLFTEEQDDEDGCGRDWEAYLDKLMTLMLAYSMAGSSGVTGAPASAQENNLGQIPAALSRSPLMSCRRISAGRREPPVSFHQRRGSLGCNPRTRRNAVSGWLGSVNPHPPWGRSSIYGLRRGLLAP